MRALYLPGLDAYLCYHDLPGRQPTRFYLPGLGGTASALFAHIATHEALAGHRSLLIDLLGFGHSDRPLNFSYTLAEQAQTIICLLEELGIRDCELIGHSAGGAIAAQVAGLRPDLVATLVLAEANLDPGRGGISAGIAAQSEADFVNVGCDALIASWRQQARAETDGSSLALLAACFQLAAPFALHRSALALRDMPQPTTRERLVQLNIPRRYLVGARTLAAQTSTGNLADWPYLAGLSVAGVELLVVPEAGHLMMLENSRGFATSIRHALESAVG